MAIERTLSIIKPDGVGHHLIGEICRRIENAGLTIIAMKMLHMTREEVEAFYDVHKGKQFFDSLVTFMTSGPVVVQVLEADDAIKTYRKIMGATDPSKAEPGTIRGDLAVNNPETEVMENVAHGSDGPESAEHEIHFFFNDGELVPRTR